MSNIKSKRSAIPGRVPTTDQLELGELALNTFDGRLFLKKNADGVESIVTLQAQKDATFAQLNAGQGMFPATYDGTSDVTFNVDPREININNLGGTSTFVQNIDINQLSGSNTFIASVNNGTDPGSYAITGSNVFRGHEVISGSILITSTVATTFNIVLVEATSSATPSPTPTPTPAPGTTPAPGSTPNPTPSPTPNPTPSPVFPPVVPVPEIYLGSPKCRQNNCGDNGPCAVNYNIDVFNSSTGDYVTVTKTSGGGTVSIIDTNPLTSVLTYYETSGTVAATYFTLYLKASDGTIKATKTASIAHTSYWTYLSLC
jgi:hypothetical protein